MTYYEVYIGFLADGPDPLDRGGTWDGNQPRRIGPLFPPWTDPALDPFSAIIQRIGNGRLQGKQVDWGAWAAIVGKKDIESFINEFYGGNYKSWQPHHLEQYAELLQIVDTLRDDRQYVLVALES